MSVLHASGPYRRGGPTRPHVPVVLPLVQVRFDDEGHLHIAVDHEPYETDPPVTRQSLRQVLDEIMAELVSPVKVEIHEPDDAVFTDIITSGTERDAQPQPVTSTMPSVPGEVAGGGFLADEEVAIAVVVAHQIANRDGTARLQLPVALFAGRSGAVVLLGRTSGTVAVSSVVSDGAA